MRNSKTKGFTLIELIVVIAIIGVLAAILVPSMLGYVRNARLSQANSNAKLVHTACAAALTQASIDNISVAATAATDLQTDTIKLNATKDSIPVKFGKSTLDLFDYLGDSFEGAARCGFKVETYTATWVAWSRDDANVSALTATKDSAAQKADAKNGTIIGYYPMTTNTTGGSSGSATATQAATT